MKKLLALALTGAMCIGLLAGCSSTKSASSAAASSTASGTSSTGSASTAAIKIGGTGPLSGANAIYGTAAKQGAEIAVAEINAKGGLQFELKYEDDEADAEKAVNAYNKLKDWGMQISLGSVTSTACAATATETNNDRIFALTPSASSASVTQDKDNMFQMCFSDPNQGTASAQYISEKKLATKVAVIYRNDDTYSSGIYNTFKAKADELGLNIVSTSTFTDSSSTDFSVQLTEAKNAGADLIFLPIYYTPASLILAQAKSMNYTPKYFGVDGMDGILTMDGFDKSLAEGVMLLTPFSADATDTLTTTFVKTYKEKYNGTPNQFAADGYDSVYAIYDACQKAKVTSDMSAKDICDLMVKTFTASDFSVDGLTGTKMTWDSTGAVSKSPKAVVIKDGAYVGLS
jgi:branched-chain amino acid transport system substrate-binding protein